MKYSDDEISKYLNILNSYQKKEEVIEESKHICKDLGIFMGKYICYDCGKLHGHVLGEFDLNDCDRLHYQKKSVYHRKYYFEKKVNKIKILNSEEKSILYERLLELDTKSIKLVNKKYSRKRVINVNFIIKKILEEMGCEKYKIIKNKISLKILEVYENWWRCYKEQIKY